MRRGPLVGVWILVAVLTAGIVTAGIAFGLPSPKPTPTRTVDWTSVPVGSDASWPHCTVPHGMKRTLPIATAPAFVVVGVNDGLPGTRSACIPTEHAWADTTTGGSSAPRLSYYVMAADPWTKPELRWVPHPTWPTTDAAGSIDVAVPAVFGSACTGGHTERACAYVYGYLTALADAAMPGLRSPATHRFWIDVEATDTWSRDPLFNQAVIEGMVAGFTAPVVHGGVGTTVGLYSDYSEWTRITGGLRAGSPLDALDEWLAVGRTTKARAVAALRRNWPFTPGGRVVMTQYIDGAIDRDVAAPLLTRSRS